MVAHNPWYNIEIYKNELENSIVRDWPKKYGYFETEIYILNFHSATQWRILNIKKERKLSQQKKGKMFLDKKMGKEEQIFLSKDIDHRIRIWFRK